jgi:2-haloacid dehalogenase
MILNITSRIHGSYKFIVSAEEWALINDYTWYVSVESTGENKLIYAVGHKGPRIKGQSLIRLHRLILDRILKDFAIDLNEEKRRHLNLAWHRLSPWSDTVPGMTRLKSRFMLTTLSNGNLGLLANMAKNAGLPWDLILSAEVFRHYKPDPETYLGVAEIFDLQPSEVMLVAAHEDDLDAAKACGLQTAFVERPLEYGVGKAAAKGDLTRFTYMSTDLNDLARQLGA